MFQQTLQRKLQAHSLSIVTEDLVGKKNMYNISNIFLNQGKTEIYWKNIAVMFFFWLKTFNDLSRVNVKVKLFCKYPKQ